jgi:DNA polymerase-1
MSESLTANLTPPLPSTGQELSSSKQKLPLLYAIDANGIAHWQWHAHCETGETTLTEATAKWFQDFKRAVNPTHIALFFDGRRNWRYGKYAEYKSARKAKEKDPAKMEALAGAAGDWMKLGIMPLVCDEFEADDCIASICEAYEGPVIIVSSDKDMMQLVTDRVKQYDPRPNADGVNKLYGPQEVIEKLDVPAHRVPELLAIWGDSADSIPGVKGWGEVKAKNAIRQTKSKTELLRKVHAGQLKDITEKNQQAFVADEASFHLCLELTTLRTDAPVPTEIDTYKVNQDETTTDNRAA